MTRQTSVYFIRAIGGFGPVKVGCSHSPESRLSQFMTWGPYPLEIVARVPGGDKTLEARFHALFRAHHSHREWFHPAPLIERTIEAINAGTFELVALPARRGLPTSRPKWTPFTKLGVRLTRALDRLRESGVTVPAEVIEASHRYALWGSALGPVSREPEDALIVQAFIAPHMKTADPSNAIPALARECGVALLQEAA